MNSRAPWSPFSSSGKTEVLETFTKELVALHAKASRLNLRPVADKLRQAVIEAIDATAKMGLGDKQ